MGSPILASAYSPPGSINCAAVLLPGKVVDAKLPGQPPYATTE
jgi:hypothetical protein